MRKYLFLCLLMILLFFSNSCILDDEDVEYIQIMIYNRTPEKISIYYYSLYWWFGYLTLTTINSYENKLVTIERDKTYYARGEISGNEYDSQSFSYYTIWYIK